MAVLPKPQAQGALPQGQAGAYASPTQIENPLGDTLNVIHGMLGKFKEKNDRTQVEEAYNKLLARQDELTLGEEGFSNIRGGDAVKNNGEFREKYSKSWQSSYNELSSGLSTEQQEAFKLRAMAARRQYDSNMMKHFGTETVNYQKDTFKASLENIQNQASINYHRPEVVAATRARAGALANDMADTLGYGPETEVYKDFMRDQLTKVHASVISGALEAEDVQYAREYIEANKDEINEDVEAQLLKKVKTYGVKKEAYELVDRVGPQYSSVAAARKAGVFSGMSPEVRETAETKLRQYYADIERAEKASDEAKTEYYQDRALVLERGEDAQGSPVTYSEMFANGDLDELTASQRNNLEAIDLQRRKGEPFVTTPEGRSEYISFMTELTPEQQAKVDYTKYRTIMGDKHYNEVKGIVEEARKSPDDITGGNTLRTPLSEAKAKFKKITGKDLDKSDEGIVFQERLEAEWNARAETKGEKLTNKEKNEVTNDLLTEMSVGGFGWFGLRDTKKPVYQLTVEDIPEKDRATLTSLFQEVNGRPPLESELLDFWRETVKEQRIRDQAKKKSAVKAKKSGDDEAPIYSPFFSSDLQDEVLN